MADYSKVKESTKLLRIRKQELADQLRTPCVKCGEQRLYVVDYHHVDPSKKSFDICKKHEHGMVKLKNEILKCVCLCANCHREFHYLYGKNGTKENLEEYLNSTK